MIENRVNIIEELFLEHRRYAEMRIEAMSLLHLQNEHNIDPRDKIISRLQIIESIRARIDKLIDGLRESGETLT